MSFSFRQGKDEVHFMTKEDLDSYNEEVESSPTVGEDVHEQYPGAVSETGEINWDCPCLGGLGTEGPCVEEFRSAFSCWMYSTADKEGGEKGDDCVDNFFSMSMCMQQNETFYEDLNARNKAEAAAAIEKYEEEEKEKLAAAEEEQKAIESSTPEPLAITESETETKTDETETKADETETKTDENVIKTDETETKSDETETITVEIETKADEIETDETETESVPTITYIRTEPEFPKADFTSNSVIVAAASDEPDSDVQIWVPVDEVNSGES